MGKIKGILTNALGKDSTPFSSPSSYSTTSSSFTSSTVSSTSSSSSSFTSPNSPTSCSKSFALSSRLFLLATVTVLMLHGPGVTETYSMSGMTCVQVCRLVTFNRMQTYWCVKHTCGRRNQRYKMRWMKRNVPIFSSLQPYSSLSAHELAAGPLNLDPAGGGLDLGMTSAKIGARGQGQASGGGNTPPRLPGLATLADILQSQKTLNPFAESPSALTSNNNNNDLDTTVNAAPLFRPISQSSKFLLPPLSGSQLSTAANGFNLLLSQRDRNFRSDLHLLLQALIGRDPQSTQVTLQQQLKLGQPLLNPDLPATNFGQAKQDLMMAEIKKDASDEAATQPRPSGIKIGLQPSSGEAEAKPEMNTAEDDIEASEIQAAPIVLDVTYRVLGLPDAGSLKREATDDAYPQIVDASATDPLAGVLGEAEKTEEMNEDEGEEKSDVVFSGGKDPDHRIDLFETSAKVKVKDTEFKGHLNKADRGNTSPDLELLAHLAHNHGSDEGVKVMPWPRDVVMEMGGRFLDNPVNVDALRQFQKTPKNVLE